MPSKPVLPLPSKAIGWRIYMRPKPRKPPLKGGLYLEVRVFASNADLLAQLALEAQALGITDPIDPYTVGLMQTPPADCPQRLYLGTVSFSREELGPDVIVHEMAHAAFAYAARKKLVINLAYRDRSWRAEDAYCYALDHFVTEFLEGAVVRGLYPPQVAP